MKLTILLSLVCLISLEAHATRVGNGGDGVRTPEGLMLLDFVEAGVELDPYFNPEAKGDEDLKAELAKALPFVDAHAIELLAGKLKEVELVDKLAAWTLSRSIQIFAWNLVAPGLLDIPDEDTNLDIPETKLFQLAVRSGKRIQINRNLWQELNSANRAGLIMHEMIYALIPPEGGRQESPRARTLVGYLFSSRIKSGGRENFLVQAKDILPVFQDQLESFKFASGKVFTKSGWKFSYEAVSVAPKVKKTKEDAYSFFDYDSNEHEKADFSLDFPYQENFPKYAPAHCKTFTYSQDKKAYVTDLTYSLSFTQNTRSLAFSAFSDGTNNRYYLSLTSLEDARPGDEGKLKFKYETDCVKLLADSILSSWKKAASKDGFSYYP